MTYLILFIIGLCVGSFLNVLIYREAVDEQKSCHSGLISYLPSWITGRSYCDHCKKEIKWFDNIPLLSYLLLAGKCRFCKKKIAFQYPLVELLTGIEFVWIYFLIKSNLGFFSRFEGFYSFLSLLCWLGLGACFLAIFIADWKYMIVPDGAVFGGILISLFKILVDYRYTGMIDFSLFTSALGACLFFGFLVFITKGKGMGLGDVKLGFLMGIVLGFPKILIALFFSFLTGALVGVILIILSKKKMKSEIAFGPFLVLGTLFALFWGTEVIKILVIK